MNDAKVSSFLGSRSVEGMLQFFDTCYSEISQHNETQGLFKFAGIETKLRAGQPRKTGSVPFRSKKSFMDAIETCNTSHAPSSGLSPGLKWSQREAS
jgi:hypothetical protein